MVVQYITNIVEVRHPSYLSSLLDWRKWRICYNGGEYFRKLYLKKFTSREDEMDFQSRQDMTPIPTYARVAINDVRNAIFQRLKDTTRRGGSPAYQQAVNGLNLGVDLRGNTMNGFLGIKVLTELLIMGRVGVYVDSPLVPGNATLADVQNYRPYLYFYPIEDILSWTCAKPDEPSTFQAILLRDVVLNFDQRTYLPTTTVERFRMLWIDRDTGKVNLQFLDTSGNPIDREGNPAGAVELELTRIPFVLLDIGDSMIKDVVNHQIALLNLVSSDVNYALKSNFPFYVEQKDQRAGGQHLKNAVGEDGTASAGGQGAADSDIKVGATQGRTYDKGMNPPSFINPSAEPLKASMDLQAKLEDDIRKLIHLSVADTANRATAESKSMDNQGLEAGLSYIGLVLEAAERQIAEFWAAYEEREPAKRDVATVKYPDRYSLKTDADRIKEAGGFGQADVRRAGPEGQTRVGEEHRPGAAGRQGQCRRHPGHFRGDRQGPLRHQRPDHDHCGGRSRPLRREDGRDGVGLQRRRAPASPRRPCGQGDSDSASPAEGRRLWYRDDWGHKT